MKFSSKATLVIAAAFVSVALGQQAPRVWTAAELFTRNVGTTEQQNKQFPPHKIIGNVYYVGTETLGTFLVTTSQGHILINTDYERNNAVIRDSIGKLGFKLEDINIDPKGFQDELTIQETAFNNELKRQEAEGAPARGGAGRGAAGNAPRGQRD